MACRAIWPISIGGVECGVGLQRTAGNTLLLLLLLLFLLAVAACQYKVSGMRMTWNKRYCCMLTRSIGLCRLKSFFKNCVFENSSTYYKNCGKDRRIITKVILKYTFPFSMFQKKFDYFTIIILKNPISFGRSNIEFLFRLLMHKFSRKCTFQNFFVIVIRRS